MSCSGQLKNKQEEIGSNANAIVGIMSSPCFEIAQAPGASHGQSDEHKATVWNMQEVLTCWAKLAKGSNFGDTGGLLAKD